MRNHKPCELEVVPIDWRVLRFSVNRSALNPERQSKPIVIADSFATEKKYQGAYFAVENHPNQIADSTHYSTFHLMPDIYQTDSLQMG